jgi:hypothetical protein
VLVSTFESLFPWDVHRARECAEACKAPVLYIEAANRLADLDRLSSLCPQLVTAKAGSGHFLSLEVPEQINPMIDALSHSTCGFVLVRVSTGARS